MPLRPGGGQPGMVHVSTSIAAVDAALPQPAYGLPRVQPGTFVRLGVRDTGCGMSEEVRAKIFDPFFATKFTGRALGLSATLGIVRAHHDAAQVESAPGRGTTFRIYFPASSGVAVSSATAVDAPHGGRRANHSSGG